MKYGNIRKLEEEQLAANWGTLNSYSFEYQREDGSWEPQQREVYDRGNGVAVVLCKRDEDRVLLTRQFRLPTHLNGNDGGMMIEACAGVLGDESPEEAMKREIEEETGYRVAELDYILTTYTSPGSVAERLHLFTGIYEEHMRVNAGGGAEDETEHIEVLEMSLEQAMELVREGKICDAKTIILLQHLALRRRDQ